MVEPAQLSGPVVMKFGGTSCQDAAALTRLARIVADRAPEHPVVVVSAMAKVTDALVELGRLALAGDIASVEPVIAKLRERHLSTLRELAGGKLGGPLAEAEAAVTLLLQELGDLVRGIAAVGELTDRTRDAVLAFGERLSPWLARLALEAAGLRAQIADARQVVITDAQHTRAQPLYAESQRQADERLVPLIAAGVVPVLGGFIGGTAAGVTTTLGRGGSDFSGAILGALLNARRIEIWTDVDGMLTADPRVCEGVRRIKVISFQEAAESAYFGAKVLHPSTLLPAMEKSIPVWVLNSHSDMKIISGPPDGRLTGTLITTRAPRTTSPIKCISCKRKIAVIDVVSTRMLQAHGFLQAIWDVFARYECPVDMVSTSEVSVSLTVSDTRSLVEIVDELGRFAEVRYEGRKAIICLVGESLRNTAGVAAKVFSAMGDINLRMISQGASEINIGMVIEDDDVPRAMRQLHDRFLADLDPAVFA